MRPLCGRAGGDAAASTGETVLHGRASGVDVALAIASGLEVFCRSSGLRPIPVAPLRVLVDRATSRAPHQRWSSE
jgi:hypothetical protein